jgi:class 3 adenylate cyclase
LTDVESSTLRWQADTATMAKELADHDTVLREAITAHGGEVFKHTGDGMCAVFVSARSAVAAALAAQAGLQLPASQT